VLWILDNGSIHTCIHFFFCKYIHFIHRNTQTQYKQTCSCTQMFALCGNQTRDLLRSRRVFPPLGHISSQITHKPLKSITAKVSYDLKVGCPLKRNELAERRNGEILINTIQFLNGAGLCNAVDIELAFPLTL
jgi:hypothetical protein